MSAGAAVGDLDFTGYETSAAVALVQHIDACLGDWDRRDLGPGLWSWYSAFDDREQVVAVNALPDRVVVPVFGWPAKMGPTILGGDLNGLFASATLPGCSDRSERQMAIAAVARLVPDLDPAAWQTP